MCFPQIITYRKVEAMHTSFQLKCLLLDHDLGDQSGLGVFKNECEKTEMTL